MITNKKHNQIIEHKDKTINDYLTKIIKLEQELKDARNLKEILVKITNLSINDISFSDCSGYYKIEIPDTVLQYTEDILGGKVIKQEGNKCLIINKNGEVKTGLTKQKIDKGYSYKLIRE